MSSQNVFTRIHRSMCAFHRDHHRALLSIQQQCEQAKTVMDLHRLSADIHSFCGGLHAHHTIEDHHIFPYIARKINISHLEAHHAQLGQMLAEFEDFARSLKQLKSLENDINQTITNALVLINKVSILVNEHERAEEQLLEPENMKKYFNEDELKRIFHV